MATSHGFNLTEATTSISAPVQVSSGLQVIVGTAPVNQLADPEAAVNTPLYLGTYKEAVAAVGWSDDFAKYTLCEAISANFQVMGTAPIVVINVLDPGKHTTPLDATTVQVNDGVAQIDKTGLLLKKLVVKKDTTALAEGTDYIATFNDDGTVNIALLDNGKGKDATTLSVSGSILDPTKVTAADIVGGVSTATGEETGLEVVRQVYPKFGKVPGILLAPRFSKDALVCAALQAKCRKINGVFNAVCYIDLDCGTSGAKKYTDVAGQKTKQTATSREAYALWLFCKVGDTVYSGSTMAAAATVYNDGQNNDCPNASPSNVTVPISAACLEDGTEMLLDQEQGTFLNDQGIATFIRSGSDFVIWGNETACYPEEHGPQGYVPVRPPLLQPCVDQLCAGQHGQAGQAHEPEAAAEHHRQREHEGQHLRLQRCLRQLPHGGRYGEEHRSRTGGGPLPLLDVLHSVPAHEAGQQHDGV